MIRVVLFASGTGTNALKLLEAAESLTNLQIPLLVVDQKTSSLPALVNERFPKVKVQLVEAPPIKDPKLRREKHESEIVALLKESEIDWCFLAGYMRIIGPTLLKAFQKADGHHRIVNIHPSLLPLYPGLDAYAKAFHAGEQESGVTVHLVDSGMDTGPVLAQSSFQRQPGDALPDFIERGKQLEWKLYPDVLKRLNDEGDLKPMERK